MDFLELRLQSYYCGMLYRGLNIDNHTSRPFRYVIGYEHEDYKETGATYSEDGSSYAVCNPESVCPGHLIKRVGNDWVDDVRGKLTEYIPERYNIANLRLFFPQYSVDTYEDGVQYALDMSISIHGHMISLGSYLISRNDALACVPVNILNEKYYENIILTVPDPYDIVYANEWASFRKYKCGKDIFQEEWLDDEVDLDERIWDTSLREINNDTTGLHISLSVVREVEGKYIKLDKYDSCQSFIVLREGGDLSVGLSHTFSDPGPERELHMVPHINQSYIDSNLTFRDALIDYMQETYFITPTALVAQVVVQDDDNIYDIYEHTIENDEDFIFDEICFDGWDKWKPGMIIRSSLSIRSGEDDNEVLFILSNKIPITQEIFKWMVSTPTKYINIDTLDMNITNINAVNKIVKKVVQNDEYRDSGKSHFMSPVFFRSQDLANIIIHPSVTENICLNLDAYKSKVDVFRIQIGDVIFNEIGRDNSGVIFKIIGKKLSNNIENGSYYILDDKNELVTTGKYKCEY